MNYPHDFYKAITYNDDETVTVTYSNIHSYHWERIKEHSSTLSEAGIGPMIYRISEDHHAITYQYVNVFSWPICHPTLTNAQVANKAREMVRYMHDELDIAHTDLAPSNVGYIGEHIYFIDHDELLKISEGITPWTQHLMELNEATTFEQLLNTDYRRFDKW